MVPNLVGKIYKLRAPLYRYSIDTFEELIVEEINSVFKILEMIEENDIELEDKSINRLKVYFFKSKQTLVIPFDLDAFELVDTEISKILYE